jgi:hypothetical protein
VALLAVLFRPAKYEYVRVGFKIDLGFRVSCCISVRFRMVHCPHTGRHKTNITGDKPNKRPGESNIPTLRQVWCLFSGTFPVFTESPTFKLCEIKSTVAGLVTGFC